MHSGDKVTQNVAKSRPGDDPANLERRVSSFEEWLRCESYLPKISDQRFISNHVRHCKHDLDEAKKKFEDWLLARYRLREFMVASWNYDYFDDELARTLIKLPKLTPEGYRIGVLRIPEDVNDFDFQKIFNYILVLMEHVVYKDDCTGFVAIYDLDHLTKEHLDKVDVKLLSETIKLIYNVFPVKLMRSYIINVPHIPETLISAARRLVNEEVMKTVRIHKEPVDLTQYLPKDCLPIEYGGVPDINISEIAQRQKKFIIENDEFVRHRASLEFVGELPQHKRRQYSFE